MDDPFDLQRFLTAQAPVFEQVRAELSEGRKRTHWMWFIFPQIAGLGFSPMARKFAISSLAEARAYLHHPILGPRLEDCTALVVETKGQTADEIFGFPDELKFRSSMTLFSRASPQMKIFTEALRKYFGGEADPATLELLQES